YIEKFYIAESKDDEFYELYVQTKGDADYSSNHKIKFTMMARNKYRDEDDKRGPEYGNIYRFEGELTAGFAKGHSDIIRDDFFTVDKDIPAVTLDKKLDVVTAQFPQLGYIKFRLANTYSYNFAYSTSVPKALLVKYPNADIRAWNFHARPEFDTASTVEFLCDGKTYAYTKDDDNNLTEFPVTFKNGDRITFKTKQLDSYIFSDKPLKTSSSSTTTVPVQTNQKPAPPPAPAKPASPMPPAQAKPTPTPAPAPTPAAPAPAPAPAPEKTPSAVTTPFSGEPLATLIFGASF
ncbi:MAG: hypothetical protein RR263_03795, partial [Oscillospiraceae bacterium]